MPATQACLTLVSGPPVASYWFGIDRSSKIAMIYDSISLGYESMALVPTTTHVIYVCWCLLQVLYVLAMTWVASSAPKTVTWEVMETSYWTRSKGGASSQWSQHADQGFPNHAAHGTTSLEPISKGIL